MLCEDCGKVDEAAVTWVIDNFPKLNKIILSGSELSPELRLLKKSKLTVEN